ncbi:MAG: alpha/beta hydrolase family protein, partial [Acidimicrobiales bacterium]
PQPRPDWAPPPYCHRRMTRPRPGRPLVLMLAVLAACSGGGNGGGNGGGSAANDAPRYAVGSRTETYVDDGSRSLLTTIYYPATADAVAVEGARPAADGGPFPLILFSHGGGTTGTSYSNLLSRIVEAGSVVAAPNYLGGGSDPTRRPADARFVISRVLAAAAEPSHPLHGVIDANRVGAMGHSAGGGVTLGFAFHSCCRDTRVRAAVLLASARPTCTGEAFPAPTIPALVVHGDADTRAPYASGRQLYDELRSPKYFVTIRGGEHTPPFSGEMQRPQSRLVVEATVAFLDQHLTGQGVGAADRLRQIVAGQPEVASLDAAA